MKTGFKDKNGKDICLDDSILWSRSVEGKKVSNITKVVIKDGSFFLKSEVDEEYKYLFQEFIPLKDTENLEVISS